MEVVALVYLCKPSGEKTPLLHTVHQGNNVAIFLEYIDFCEQSKVATTFCTLIAYRYPFSCELSALTCKGKIIL